MKQNRNRILGWAAYFCAALVCQWLWGDLPVAFFAFPVNVSLVLLGGVALVVGWRERRQPAWIRQLAAPATAWLLLLLLAATCLAQGLGGWSLSRTWWFAALCVALMAHLWVILLRRAGRKRPHRGRFLLIHGGLLAVLLGGFAGAPDEREWRALLPVGRAVDKAFSADGTIETMRHRLTLERVDVERDAAGLPRTYAAQITVGGRGSVTLEVNHPYDLSWQDRLYLASLWPAAEGYCVVQLVRQPWRGVMWAGIWMMMAGSVLLFVQGFKRERRQGA